MSPISVVPVVFDAVFETPRVERERKSDAHDLSFNFCPLNFFFESFTFSENSKVWIYNNPSFIFPSMISKGNQKTLSLEKTQGGFPL